MTRAAVSSNKIGIFKRWIIFPLFFVTYALATMVVMMVPCLILGFLSMFSSQSREIVKGAINSWWEIWEPVYLWIIDYVEIETLDKSDRIDL